MLDFCVIGGGIVGLATACRLLENFPGCGLRLLEKEADVAQHQTGHNSGVIHAGIYYAPGSLKAQLCRAGSQATKRFCAENAIPFQTCGKLVVATTPLEASRMATLAERAAQNDINFETLGPDALREREPNVAGTAALFVPGTAIVDYRAICRAFAARIRSLGGEILVGAQVDRIEEQGDCVRVFAGDQAVTARQLVACAGLQADRVAALAGLSHTTSASFPSAANITDFRLSEEASSTP